MSNSGRFPIYIAYPKPSRFIRRNEKDKWESNLEEINTLAYDYVKLHRLSTSFDVGLSPPFCLHVGFNGALVLPAIPELRPAEKASAIFNKFLGKLALGGLIYETSSPNENDMGFLYETGYFRSIGGSHGTFAQIQSLIQSKIAGPIHTADLMNPIAIFAEEMKRAYDEGAEIISLIPNLSAELLLFGVSAYIQRAWAESLTNLWICVEQVISHFWNKEMIEKADQSILGRRDFLKDNRTWTTSTKSEMLFNKGLIDGSTYALLSKARKARNELVHRGTIPDSSDVDANLEAFFRLVSIGIGKGTDHLQTIVDKAKQMDSVRKFHGARAEEAKPIQDEDAIWLGPMPPIPGESEWGNKPYEQVYPKKATGN